MSVNPVLYDRGDKCGTTEVEECVLTDVQVIDGGVLAPSQNERDGRS